MHLTGSEFGIAGIEVLPVGLVEPRNPKKPALKERSMDMIGHLYIVPMLRILNIQLT
jgi:hypothetical protein